MDQHERDLFDRVAAFEFDEPGTELTFRERLAREHAWPLSFAARVIEEYKKFAFLAMTAGHPVCPSDDVDEAWHLHLTYTRSYWHDFCPLLGKPLHHHPTKGGAAELAKHVGWYQQTLASYRRMFGHGPPADIWPTAAERFHFGRGRRRVDLNDNWVIPKPRLRRLGALVMAAGAAGPAAGMTLNPFDFNGPTFILLYLMLLVVAVIAALLLRRSLRGGEQEASNDSLGPYETAYLAGGKRLAIRAALAALVNRGALVVRRDEK
ncbi:MAG TPA: TIGR04222 domain-containing membrane protein, partial [Pirellulales bacterium]|nr:TIGR04222 domain-containing membrane protein [Pirellulales bacterium]